MSDTKRSDRGIIWTLLMIGAVGLLAVTGVGLLNPDQLRDVAVGLGIPRADVEKMTVGELYGAVVARVWHFVGLAASAVLAWKALGPVVARQLGARAWVMGPAGFAVAAVSVVYATGAWRPLWDLARIGAANLTGGGGGEDGGAWDPCEPGEVLPDGTVCLGLTY